MGFPLESLASSEGQENPMTVRGSGIRKGQEKKSDLVSVQMAPSMKKAIERRAAAEEVSVGHWCRGVFKEKLEAKPAAAPAESAVA
jgi:hypothetical protein